MMRLHDDFVYVFLMFGVFFTTGVYSNRELVLIFDNRIQYQTMEDLRYHSFGSKTFFEVKDFQLLIVADERND